MWENETSVSYQQVALLLPSWVHVNMALLFLVELLLIYSDLNQALG